METKIQKWGNSLGLRIPKTFAEQTGVMAGSAVHLAVEEGEIIIRPLRRPKYDLQELLNGVTKENVHQEVDTGEPAGKEVW